MRQAEDACIRRAASAHASRSLGRFGGVPAARPITPAPAGIAKVTPGVGVTTARRPTELRVIAVPDSRIRIEAAPTGCGPGAGAWGRLRVRSPKAGTDEAIIDSLVVGRPQT
jgi:hypothetical protein